MRFYEAVHNLKMKLFVGDRKPFREFAHSEDLGRAVVFALEKWNLSPQKLQRKKW